MAAAVQLVVPVSVPQLQSRVDPIERAWTSSTRWGDLRGSTLTGVVNRAKTGDVADWADLCEEALKTSMCGSLYRSRIDRVVQAQWAVRPPKDSDNPALAMLAAEFVDEQIKRIDNMKAGMRWLLHALAIGYSAAECVYQRDRVRGINYVSHLQLPHAHRFRYDEQWQLRLYDRGHRSTRGSLYGEQLDPRGWIVHEVRTVAGYPGFQGHMTECIWYWTFLRWVERWRIAHQEKYGSPMPYAQVPPNTVKQVREQVLEDLQNFTSQHAAVFDIGMTIDQIEAAATSDEGYANYVKDVRDLFKMAWLGVTDATDAGDHGSQNAVEGRIAAVLDPRTATDADDLSETLKASLVRGLLGFNLHKLGVQLHEIPLPEIKLATEENEIDAPTAGREQSVASVTDDGSTEPLQVQDASPDDPTPTAAPAATPTADVQKQALNGAQVTSLLELLNQVASGALPRASAIELIVAAFPIDTPQAERLLGEIGDGFVPTVPEAEPYPKAATPVAPGTPSSRSTGPSTYGHRAPTRPTFSRSASPFAKSLRRG